MLKVYKAKAQVYPGSETLDHIYMKDPNSKHVLCHTRLNDDQIDRKFKIRGVEVVEVEHPKNYVVTWSEDLVEELFDEIFGTCRHDNTGYPIDGEVYCLDCGSLVGVTGDFHRIDF